ncbi:TetR/AcrR family transcriptional regulator [Vibrio tapetis subsp. quintayensis]|uniref:TetR/AcrR family transcriptional regulator n=1 Tax=Vibrio tapetis TaxID=52443 RepID=UPI0025B57549|nr:TetR/AcrR family transcriptional regulator [Vibrio tapetis]MDN3681623.1 TetR/AcrR family transcriptional regulator [Vibrio tapetis subsp. quintayensis]
MVRKAGRPLEKTDARASLVFHARELFSSMPYEKVSTRMLAEKAGVNMAMIRYYFGSKDGLFETMLRETMEPMKQHVSQLVTNNARNSSDKDGFLGIMKTYYAMMIKSPDFPRLLCRVMLMEESSIQRKLVEKVFKDVTLPAQKILFQKMQQDGVIRPELDPDLCRMTYVSLMVFPFIAPPQMLNLHGVVLDEAYLKRLLDHNLSFIAHGFLLDPYSKLQGHSHDL